METIFNERIDSYLKSQPKTLLKVNYELNNLGFKQILNDIEIKPNLYYKDLTLIESISNYNTKVVIKKERENLEKLKGFYTGDLYYCDIPEGVEVIKHNGVEWGFYSRDKNYVCMFYNFISRTNTNSGEKNEVLFYILDIIKKFNEKNPFETKDIRDIGRKIVAEQFNKVWIDKRNNNTRNLERFNDDIIKYQEGIINNYKNISLIIKENETISQNLNKGLEKVEEVIKKLEESKFLKKVEIENGEIMVDYGDISIKIKGKEIYLGNYQAYLGSTGIRILNKNPIHYESRLLHHPHISNNEGTSICFGSQRSSEISKLMSDLEYDKLVYMILLFLKNYTEGDCYHKIYYWEKSKEVNGERIYNG